MFYCFLDYIQTYPAQQPYQSAQIQPTKFGLHPLRIRVFYSLSSHVDQYSYDKETHAHYGQAANSLQPTKDTPMTSKLSANAATFPQGAPLAATSPATAFYINPFLYTMPTYYASHQDRSMTYPSVDNRVSTYECSFL